MQKQTVFFDLGNVLIFFSYEKMWNQLAELTRLSPSFLKQKLMQRGVFRDYECGRFNSEAFFRILQSYSSSSFTFLETMRATSDIFTPNQDLWPLVHKLKEQNTRLILLSNTNECHFNFAYSHYSVLKLFDRFILSYEIKASKPHKAIFEKALQEARGRSFYTDDIADYIQAAKQIGLNGAVFQNAHLLQKNLESKNFLIPSS